MEILARLLVRERGHPTVDRDALPERRQRGILEARVQARQPDQHDLEPTPRLRLRRGQQAQLLE